MNRQIKFRAWDGKEMWYQGDKDTCLVFFGQKGRIPFGIYNDAESRRLMTGDRNAIFNAPAEILQFTGLKDKNGKEIYEGDICEGHSDGVGVITWTDFDGGYDYVFDDEANVGIWEVKGIKIIGNIYENPELLPQTKTNDSE